MAEDDERLLEADAHVDALTRRLVQVGIALDGGHDLADPIDRHGELLQELVHGCLRRQPSHDFRRLVAQEVRPPAGVDERGSSIGSVSQSGDLVDHVGSLQRRARGRGIGRRLRRRCRSGQCIEGRHRITEGARGAGRGGGGIVELVCHAGDERAEGGQLLALAERRLHRSEAPDGGPNDGQRHVGPGGQQLAHGVDRDAQGLTLGHRADGREATASPERRDLSLERSRADA